MVELIEDAAARADLEAILEGVAEQYGVRTALDVADAVRTAAHEGRMDGRNYVACTCMRDDCKEKFVCVVGIIALALNSFERDDEGAPDSPVVPNWNYYKRGLSPIEHLVEDVRPGDTAATNACLATLVRWIQDWCRQRAA